MIEAQKQINQNVGLHRAKWNDISGPRPYIVFEIFFLMLNALYRKVHVALIKISALVSCINQFAHHV